MVHYGIVNFNIGGEKSAKAQAVLLRELSKKGVITLKRNSLEEIFEADRKKSTGMTDNFVLHNDQETEIFREIMHLPELRQDWIRWRTTTRLGKRNEFRKWLEKRGAYHECQA